MRLSGRPAVTQFRRAATRLAMAAALALAAVAAHAHTPHDDAFAVAHDPGDPSGARLLAIVRSSVYRSGDGGETWQRIVRGLDSAAMLYALAWDADGGAAYVASLGDGVFVSTDGGESWTRRNRGLASRDIEAVATAPGAPGTAVALARDGRLFLTRDRGAGWAALPAPEGGATAIAFEHGATGRLLAAAGGRILATDDAGATWSPVASLPGTATVTAFATPPGGAGQLLVGGSDGVLRAYDTEAGGAPVRESRLGDSPVTAIAATPGGFLAATLWREGAMCSEDGGGSWSACAEGIEVDAQWQELGRPAFAGIALSPAFASDGTAVMASYQGLFRSTDRGRSWGERETLPAMSVIGLDVAARPEGSDPTLAMSNMLWGLYLSDDGGENWRSASAGIAEPYPRDEGYVRVFQPVLSPAYADDRTLFTSTWYDIYLSRDGGDGWRRVSPDAAWWEEEGFHGVTLAPSPSLASDGTVFAGTHRGRLVRSTDGGASFAEVAQLGGAVGGIAFSPGYADDGTVLAAHAGGVAVSTDRGDSWTVHALLPPPPDTPETPRSLRGTGEVAGWPFFEAWETQKARSGTVAAATGAAGGTAAFAGTSAGLFRAEGDLSRWRRVALPGGLSDRPVEAVALSPDFARDGTVLAVVAGHGLFRSTDGGESFAAIAPDLLADQVAFAHHDGLTPKFPTIRFSPGFARDGTVYAFAGPRLWRSADRGESWAEVAAPAPPVTLKVKAAFVQEWVARPRSEKLVILAVAAALGAALLAAMALAYRQRARRA